MKHDDPAIDRLAAERQFPDAHVSFDLTQNSAAYSGCFSPSVGREETEFATRADPL
jgi:hypothetical protein